METRANKKRKRKEFYKSFRKIGLSTLKQCKGFLVTCDQGRERRAIKEAKSIIMEACDNVSSEVKSANLDLDINHAIDEELRLHKTEGASIVSVDSGAKGILLLRLENIASDPVDLLSLFFLQLQQNPESKSTSCIRIIPIQTFCRSTLGEIEKLTRELVRQFFSSFSEKTCKFSILFKRRYADTVEREATIAVLANLVVQVGNENSVVCTVALKEPQMTVIVEVFKSVAGLSIVKSVQTFNNFNIRRMANN